MHISIYILAGLLAVTPMKTIESPKIASTSPEIVEIEEVIQTPEQAIYAVFSPEIAPVMVEVARCESNLRQFDSEGNVLISNLGTDDRGLFQIHYPIWGEKAIELGYDIHTMEGNILMAKHILETQGISAWKPSLPCHGHLSLTGKP